MGSKVNWMKLGSMALKGVALALPYIVDRFIDSKLDAEETEEFVREIVREEIENTKG
jgi:hypothetical protein